MVLEKGTLGVCPPLIKFSAHVPASIDIDRLTRDVAIAGQHH